MPTESTKTTLTGLFTAAMPPLLATGMAERAVARFGTLEALISEDPGTLRATLGDPAAALIGAVRTTAEALARERVMDGPVLSGWDRLLEYLKVAMAHDAREQFRVLFLDNRNRLIADEVMGRGTVNHTPVYPREVIKRALELHATAMILAHNHPSGDPTPSREDIALTQEIRGAAELMRIVLHDHLIVGTGRVLSFRQEGLL